jgi:hypothetical protein
MATAGNMSTALSWPEISGEPAAVLDVAHSSGVALHLNGENNDGGDSSRISRNADMRLLPQQPVVRQRHQKRSSSRRAATGEELFASYAANFEFLSTWNLTADNGGEEGGGGSDLATATEMTDDQLRSLGFPVPSPPAMAATLSPSLIGRGSGGGVRQMIPVVDNPFIHFVSRKYASVLTLILPLPLNTVFSSVV